MESLTRASYDMFTFSLVAEGATHAIVRALTLVAKVSYCSSCASGKRRISCPKRTLTTRSDLDAIASLTVSSENHKKTAQQFDLHEACTMFIALH